ncbi:hypothetical protein [Caulobacter sp. UNC279MFTsu5.1]|uniref:hypothetical protein n=1 Tax=Caulobacter sp. UNC279MFTsu5.1 TaxID=1502775 RepID=UPI0003605CE2|nr:hypothetical protein [Caulobacter sp. UNC279MFTsu5.1]SFK06545.1 hypothetical protein SAMN02799626_03301 [Caulobacter sp. UNC279MFTsu5.1]
MSLRVHGLPMGGGDPPSVPTAPDGWATRLAKLIPAEALGLYGAATGVLPPMDNTTLRLVFLIIIAAACLAMSIAIRYKSTSLATGRPQVWAIVISSVSFVIWLMSLGIPNSPIPIPQELAFIPTIIAVIWTTAIGVFYRGDTGEGSS